MSRAAARWLVLPPLALLSACLVVPRTVSVYDPSCRSHSRQMTLEIEAIGGFNHCAGDGCVALLVSAGVVAAASAVVSGSIVIAGNIVYWFERQGGCPP